MSKKIKLVSFNSLAKPYRQARPGYSKYIIHLLKSLLLLRNKIINTLDLGSGIGIFTKEISKISDRVIGVELSKEMIKVFRYE